MCICWLACYGLTITATAAVSVTESDKLLPCVRLLVVSWHVSARRVLVLPATARPLNRPTCFVFWLRTCLACLQCALFPVVVVNWLANHVPSADASRARRVASLCCAPSLSSRSAATPAADLPSMACSASARVLLCFTTSVDRTLLLLLRMPVN